MRCLTCDHDPTNTERELWRRIGKLETQLNKAQQCANLRDQFAMAALTGLLAGEANPAINTVIEPTNMGTFPRTVNFAYVLADAMMVEREAK